MEELTGFSATMVEETADRVVFEYTVIRGRYTHQQLLDATARVQLKDDKAVVTMPLSSGSGSEDSGRYVFHKLDRNMTDSEVEQHRQALKLIRDFEVQVLINARFPEFADKNDNGDSWWVGRKWGFVTFFFREHGSKRCVRVGFRSNVWVRGSWIGGRE